jgi:L-malate glycosyltransferase
MIFGVVPIVTRVSGAADIVEDGRSGFLTPVDDLAALTHCIEEAIDMTAARRAEMSRSAVEMIRRKFGIDEVATRHLAIYRQLLDEGVQGRSGWQVAVGKKIMEGS